MADCWTSELDSSHDAGLTVRVDNLEYVVDAENTGIVIALYVGHRVAGQ
jgi:hypothetical protein